MGGFARVGWAQGTVALAGGSSGWRQANEANDRAALTLGQTRLATIAGAIREAIDAFGVEAKDALTHSLRMAVKFSGDGGGREAIPASADHASAEH